MERVATPFLSDEEAATTTFKPGRWRALEPGQERIPASPRAFRPSSIPPQPSLCLSLPSPPSLLGLSPEDRNREAEPRAEGLAQELAHRGAEGRRISPTPLGAWLTEHPLFPGGAGATLLGTRSLLVQLERPFAVRARAVRLITPARASSEQRLLRQRNHPEQGVALGGPASPIVGFFGPGRLWAQLESGTITLVTLRDESITLRESALVGFDLGLCHDCSRLSLGHGESIEMVSLDGRGVVAFHTLEPPCAQQVSDQDAILLADHLVGWCGPLVPRPLDFAESPGKQRAFLVFEGEGQLLLEKSPGADRAGT